MCLQIEHYSDFSLAYEIWNISEILLTLLIRDAGALIYCLREE